MTSGADIPHVAPAVEWHDVWREVARKVRAHRQAGRGHLLTEDVVRMETVLALEAGDVLPGRLAVEYRAPELRGGKLDLVLDPPSGCVVELKYPRDSRTGFSPDTMTLGELVRDFLRVAAVPADDRWVVQVLTSRLQRYLSGLQHRHGLPWPLGQDETFALEPAVLAALPGTAVNAIGPAALEAVVLGRVEVVEQNRP